MNLMAKRDYDRLMERLRRMKRSIKSAQGLGDAIKATTDALGIKPCATCPKRQEWLNQAVPFNRSG